MQLANIKLLIKKDILNSLNEQISNRPPESGGILGSSGNVITEIAFDKPNNNQHPCSYCPNVEYLNSIIHKWSEQKIEFAGIFHTHFADVTTLSSGDKRYIKKILLAMPDGTECLYFPVYALPSRALIMYHACIKEDKLKICTTEFEIV